MVAVVPVVAVVAVVPVVAVVAVVGVFWAVLHQVLPEASASDLFLQRLPRP